jgi:hypothetical protein
MVKQSGRKQSPCLPTKQAHDAPFQANEEIRKLCLGRRQRPQFNLERDIVGRQTFKEI